MPKILTARPAMDATEETKIRKPAHARHAPADRIERAKTIVASWKGLRAPQIATTLGGHQYKVRRWLHRFNTEGLDGPGNRPGRGRKRRITEAERSRLIELARGDPPGRPLRNRWGSGSPVGTTKHRGGPGTPSPRPPGKGASHPPLPGADDPAGRPGAPAAPPPGPAARTRTSRKGRRSSPRTPTRPQAPPSFAPTNSAR